MSACTRAMPKERGCQDRLAGTTRSALHTFFFALSSSSLSLCSRTRRASCIASSIAIALIAAYDASSSAAVRATSQGLAITREALETHLLINSQAAARPVIACPTQLCRYDRLACRATGTRQEGTAICRTTLDAHTAATASRADPASRMALNSPQRVGSARRWMRRGW